MEEKNEKEEKSEKKEYRNIGYIERGIVIDHIPERKVWKIAEILGVYDYTDGRVSIGDGYDGHDIETGEQVKKGILKIEGKYLSPMQINLIALVSEKIRVSFISSGQVKEKFRVKIPEVLEGLVICPNSNCISNNQEEYVYSKIHYDSKKGFRCHYCEREFNEEELELRFK
jgi:aspartate carbamoyltransferase regulatory subunit